MTPSKPHWTPEARAEAAARAKAMWAARRSEEQGRRFRIGRLVIVWAAR
ncbi:MAG: hypothetical protein QOJ13_2801 [Gaiellales bacterium]|jgi:hypothetical protein|nr:hypothetical protein [Gaiellales bacterium]